MRGHAYIRSAIVAAGILGVTGSMQPAAAAPLAPATRTTQASTLDVVQVRGGRDGAALAAGLATGLIVGGLLSAPHYYEGPYPYYHRSYYPPPPPFYGPVGYAAPGWEAYCFSRYRSFDPISGTYLGYDGRRHFCR